MKHRRVFGVIVFAALAALGTALGTRFFSSRQYAPSSPVGDIGGSFAVDSSGTASYSVPIQVPPGTDGVAPGLTVSYFHTAQNGYLGIGWNLRGISAITRCAATFALDGFRAGVSFGQSDRFCMDGERLILVAGTYGADGSVYRTEQDTRTVYTASGACGAGPCSFTALSSAGDTLTFGVTAGLTGSRIPAQGRTDSAVRVWSVDRFTDLNGNAVTFSYFQNTSSGEYYPARIDYTSNASAGLAASRSITFNYTSASREDGIQSYLAGSKISVTRLMTGLTSKVDGNVALNYVFGYETAPITGNSRLKSITKCDAGGVCLPATTIAYTSATGAFFDTGKKLPGPLYVIIGGVSYPSGLLLDFDGDGILDYCHATEFVGSTRSLDLTLYRGQPDGSFVSAGYSLPGPVFRATAAEVVRFGSAQDVNGDGILDYVKAIQNNDSGESDLSVYLGTAAGFTKDPSYQLPGPLFIQNNHTIFATGILLDMNGDGLPDYSRATFNSTSGQYILKIFKGTGSGFADTGKTLPGALYALTSSASVQWGVLQDMNGDGIPDYTAGKYNASKGEKDYAVYAGASDFSFTKTFALPDMLIYFANGVSLDSGTLTDINGDGIADYTRASKLPGNGQVIKKIWWGTGAGYTDSGLELPGPLFAVSTGQSLIQGMLTGSSGNSNAEYSAGMLHQDGTTDYAIFVGGQNGFLDTGANLPGPIFRTQNASIYGQGVYQDINGDGMFDYARSVCVLTNQGSLQNCDLGVYFASGPFPDLASKFTGGSGGTTQVNYAPISNSAVYSPGPSSTFPVRNIQGSKYVVSRYVTGDGRGSNYAYSNRYFAARVDVNGRGWLGFLKVTSTEEATSRSSVAEYMKDYPYYGLVSSSTELDDTGKIMFRTQNTYVDTAPAAFQTLGIHTPMPSSNTVTYYSGGAPSFNVTSKFEYDGHANVVIVSNLNDVDTPADDVYSCSRYLNDVAKNRTGYVVQSKTTKTYAACQAFIVAPEKSIVWNAEFDLRWTKIAYDPANMNKLAQSIYDDSHSKFQQASFTYDAVGNLRTATDYAGNVTTYEYDPDYRTFLTSATSPQLTRNGAQYRLVEHYTSEPLFGQVVQNTNFNSKIVSQSIDGFGRVVAVFAPDESDTNRQVTSSIWKSNSSGIYLENRRRQTWSDSDTANWHWERTYVDGMNREYRTETLGINNGTQTSIVTDIVFDAAGRVYKESAPHFSADTPPYTTTTYDRQNRPDTVTAPDGVVTKYDYADGGRKVTETEAYGTGEAAGSVSNFDARHLLVSETEPNGLLENFVYDRLGQLSSAGVSHGGVTMQRKYNSLGRLILAGQSDTGNKIYAYDASARLLTVTDADGNSISFSGYDPMNRFASVSQTAIGVTRTVGFDYDSPATANGLGEITGVTMNAPATGTFSYSYSYHPLGQPAARSFTIGGKTYSLSNTYYPTGELATSTFPDGSVLTQSYRADLLPESVSLEEPGGSNETYASYTNYTALGQVGSYSYPVNNSKFNLAYYPLGPSFASLKSNSAQIGLASPYFSKTYEWNRHSSVKTVTDNLKPAASTSYTYGGTGGAANMQYLAAATSKSGNHTYGYDELGNITSKNGGTYKYEPNTNRLISANGLTYSYGKNGTMSRRGSVQFKFDALSNLTEVNLAPGIPPVDAAEYDYLGERVYLAPAETSQKFYFAGGTYEAADLGDGLWQNTKYIQGPFGQIASVTRQGSGLDSASADFVRYDTMAKLNGGAVWSKRIVSAFFGTMAFAYYLKAEHRDAGIALFALALMLASTIAAVRSNALLARWKRKHGAGFAIRRRPIQAAVTPIVIFVFLATHVTPVLAELVPGANGSGTPSQGRLFFTHDHLDSVVAAVDDSGNLSASVAYVPYGSIDSGSSSGVDNFRPKFGSHEWNQRTGLYNFGARYFDPSIGRFISPDPAGQFVSPYLYGADNPASYIDPDGRFAVSIAIVGALVGAYFGAAAVNHTYNPLQWNFNSWKTYAGLLVGAGIGAVGSAAGEIVAEAAIAAGSMNFAAAPVVGAAIGITGMATIGAAENAAFAALGGESPMGIAEAALMGAAFGAAFEGAGMLAGAASRRISSALADDAGGQVEKRVASDVSEEAEENFPVCLPEGSSFIAGTIILDGNGSPIPIENVARGSQVLAMNLADGSVEPHEVVETRSRATSHLIEITLASGKKIIVTPEHPFRGYKRGWIKAGDLDSGSLLTGRSGVPVEVKTVRSFESSEPVRVYNFTVANAGNYFVSEIGILAHNVGPWTKCKLSKLPPGKPKAKTSAKRAQAIKKFGDRDVRYRKQKKGRMEIDFLAYSLGEVDISNVGVSDIQLQYKRGNLKRSKAGSLIRGRHSSYAKTKLGIRGGMLQKIRVALHHSVDGKKLQAVIRDVHENWGHVGGIAESYLK